MASSTKICKHLHLPVQSGSSRILEKMNRKYSKESYLELVNKIRLAIPDISITTDIIIGFPGETENDFLETMDLVKQVRYDTAFTFQYSRRTGTPAASMDHQVTEEIMTDRFQRLLSVIQEITASENLKHEGKIMDVLVEEVNHQDDSLLSGKCSNNLSVHFAGTKDLIGKIVPVKLTTSKGFYYLGEQVGN